MRRSLHGSSRAADRGGGSHQRAADSGPARRRGPVDPRRAASSSGGSAGSAAARPSRSRVDVPSAVRRQRPLEDPPRSGAEERPERVTVAAPTPGPCDRPVVLVTRRSGVSSHVSRTLVSVSVGIEDDTAHFSRDVRPAHGVRGRRGTARPRRRRTHRCGRGPWPSVLVRSRRTGRPPLAALDAAGPGHGVVACGGQGPVLPYVVRGPAGCVRNSVGERAHGTIRVGTGRRRRLAEGLEPALSVSGLDRWRYRRAPHGCSSRRALSAAGGRHVLLACRGLRRSGGDARCSSSGSPRTCAMTRLRRSRISRITSWESWSHRPVRGRR